MPVFGFKVKHAATRQPGTPHCTMPVFGFKAKHGWHINSIAADCTMPVFGFKAKPIESFIRAAYNCTMPVFGFKAKQPQQAIIVHTIVPCLCLDSRQNSITRISIEQVKERLKSIP